MANLGLHLSVIGYLGLQSRLLSSLYLNLRRNWQHIKSKVHDTWGCHITQSKEHIKNKEETPETVRDREGLRMGAEGGAQGKEEAKRMKNMKKGKRMDL